MTYKIVAPSLCTLTALTLFACSGSSDNPLPSGTGAAPNAGVGGGQVNGQGGNGQQGGGTSNGTGGGQIGNGGNAAIGGAVTSGGTSAATGGATAAAGRGGTVATGGATAVDSKGGAGGATTTVGGSATGGSTAALGGSNVGGKATGGAATGTGGKATGGAATSNGGTTNTGGSGNTGGCVPATCGTHKWACWKMPNPTGSGLPNLASYTASAGVVHDNVTCLDWQQVESSSSYTNAEAITYCEGLSLGGFDDWRAPTRVEMMSIMDWTRSPATDVAFTGVSGFHKTGSNWILTISQTGAGAGTDFAWAFNMGDGITSNAYSAATAARIRCVRGNGSGESFGEKAVAPPSQYTAVSADEAQDNYTGLIWQRSGNASGLITWDAAVTYCANLTLGGAKWRLPSVRELSTLVDEALVAPAINRTMFPNTQYGARSNNWYWASHRQRGSTTASWGLNFDDGFTGANSGAAAWNTFGPSYAKCVR